MRKLQTQDVFKFMRVISAAGLKEDFKKFLSGNGGKKLEARDLGVDIIFMVMERAAGESAEQAIYEFLAGPLETDAKAVAEMDLLELIKTLEECIDMESWKVFFKHVSALTMK